VQGAEEMSSPTSTILEYLKSRAKWSTNVAILAVCHTSIRPAFVTITSGLLGTTAYLRPQSYGNAIVEFAEAIRLRPDYANAYQNRAVARRHAIA
jgi:hypothetical protein